MIGLIVGFYLDVVAQEMKDHQLVKGMYEGEKTPAFVPGRVLYIRETGKRIHRRCVCACVCVCV